MESDKVTTTWHSHRHSAVEAGSCCGRSPRCAVALQDCGPRGGVELTAFQLVPQQPAGPFPRCTGNLYANPSKSLPALNKKKPLWANSGH